MTFRILTPTILEIREEEKRKRCRKVKEEEVSEEDEDAWGEAGEWTLTET